MLSYEKIRQSYKPEHIKMLLIAESPPPASGVQSSRQFYYTDRIRKDDRLFINTLRALYPQTTNLTENELQEQKAFWLERFKTDGWYMIEALETSQPHEVSKQERQLRIAQALPRLLQRVTDLAAPDTKIILIKSNVFEVAAQPLRAAGFIVLNTANVDYPGRFNQRAYRQKLAALAKD